MSGLHDQRASVSSSAISGARSPILAPRQRETLRHMALGMTAWETARAMGVAEQSVKNNLQDVYRRLDASCLADALRAVGWLRVPDA